MMRIKEELPQEEPDEEERSICFVCHEDTADPLITICVYGRGQPLSFHPACAMADSEGRS